MKVVYGISYVYFIFKGSKQMLLKVFRVFPQFLKDAIYHLVFSGYVDKRIENLGERRKRPKYSCERVFMPKIGEIYPN